MYGLCVRKTQRQTMLCFTYVYFCGVLDHYFDVQHLLWVETFMIKVIHDMKLHAFEFSNSMGTMVVLRV